MPSVRAVATIGAPSDPSHVTALFDAARESITTEGEADVQLAAQLAVQAVDVVAEALQRAEQLQRRLVHLAAFLGQGEAGAAALAQAQAQALLQVAHLLADGRAADAQHALGGGEAAALDHAAEQAQQADIEVADLGQGVGTAAAHMFSTG
jgi:hypothetical protein